MKVFSNCTVVLQFDSLTSFKDKLSWRKKITENGGVVSYVLTKKASFLVVFNTKNASCSFKIRQSHRHNIPVVGPKYVDQCLTRKRLLDIGSYKLTDENNNERFTKGKIAGNQSTILKQKKKKRVPVKLGSHPSFIYGDVDAPFFIEDSFELPKWALLVDKDYKTIQVLEVHVAPGDVKENKVRLFAQNGTVADKKVTSVEDGIVWYFDTVDSGVSGYEKLYRRYTTSPVNMGVCEPGIVEIDNLGSKQFKMVLGKLSLLNEKISPQVAALTDHIWNSALEEVDNLLQVEMQFVREKQVEDGRLALARIADKLVSGSGGIQHLYDEFYEAIPYKTEHRKTDWTLKDVVINQDLCQLLADIISVSEATDWSIKATVIAKYQALGCHLSAVNQSDDEFKNISQKIQSTLGEGGRVHNIYKIRRTIEEVSFQSNIGEVKQLMHASQFSNYLGILSRGLILPNVVKDKLGVARTDAGLLGAGIYFTDSARKSAHYSTPNPQTGTRLMLLCDVALGQKYEVTEPDINLTVPPEGFDSVQGVKVTDDNNSFFKEDEFAIYNPNQQCMKYLVEFSLPSDDVKCQPGVDGIDLVLDKLPPEQTDNQGTNIDIKDVKDIPDPLAKIKAGLQGNKNEHVPLKAVHVRAKLMDMISQVVVLQAYRNDNKKAIEAKYVFPLDSYAAVCGFEAFINGKHIIGEVKEKAKARKEYREAVSKGHGAYLMEEETPDVFSVSVGNLPPNSNVLIKITYVAELQVDGDAICFILPSAVAPWLRDGTLAQKTQSTTSSVKILSNKKCAFSLQCSLEMPSDIRKISSPTHKINCKKTATKAVITLPKKAPLNDGFQLNVYLAEIHVPRMWVEKHPILHTQACMLTFYPEFETNSEVDPEIILLIDMSNSMKSGSEESAKKVALLLLDNLPTSCQFNIVIFGSSFKELFPSTQKYSKASAVIAKKHIQDCSANMGSTDIWSPLHASQILSQSNTYTSNLFVVSDGHVTQESEVVMATKKAVQTNRVFTLGVGTTANHHLLRNLASSGGGTYEYYSEDVKSAWQRKLCSQVEKACQPGLSDVKVDWLQTNDNAPLPAQAPNQIPCLFSGNRQVVYGFVESCMQATLKAKIGGYDMSTMVSTTDLHVTTGEILHRLTARAMIADYENGIFDGDRIQHQIQKADRKQYIIDLSKQFSIVTQYTSFVAIEDRSQDDSVVNEVPAIDDLVAKETVDILPYMGYDSGEQEDEKDPEVCVTELLQRGEVAESFSMVQAEETYNELDSYIETIVEKTELLKKVYITLTRFYSQTQGQSIGDIISQIEPAYKVATTPESPAIVPHDVEMAALMPPEISPVLADIRTLMMDIENLPFLPSDDSDLTTNVIAVYDKKKIPSKKKKKKQKMSHEDIFDSIPMSESLMLEESHSLSSLIQPPASLSLLNQFDPSTAYFDPKARSMTDRDRQFNTEMDPQHHRFKEKEQTAVYFSAAENSNTLAELKVLNGTACENEFLGSAPADLCEESERITLDNFINDTVNVIEVLNDYEDEESPQDFCMETFTASNAQSRTQGSLNENNTKNKKSQSASNQVYCSGSPSYSPTSPSYSPTSPAYLPTSPAKLTTPAFSPAYNPVGKIQDTWRPASRPIGYGAPSGPPQRMPSYDPMSGPPPRPLDNGAPSGPFRSKYGAYSGDQPMSSTFDVFLSAKPTLNKNAFTPKAFSPARFNAPNLQGDPVTQSEFQPTYTHNYLFQQPPIPQQIQQQQQMQQQQKLSFDQIKTTNFESVEATRNFSTAEHLHLIPVDDRCPEGPNRQLHGSSTYTRPPLGGEEYGIENKPSSGGLRLKRGSGEIFSRGGRGRGASGGRGGKNISRGKQIASKAARKSCPAEDAYEDIALSEDTEEGTNTEEEKTEDKSWSRSREKQRNGLRLRCRSMTRRDRTQRSRSISRQKQNKYSKDRSFSRDRKRSSVKEDRKYRSSSIEEDQSHSMYNNQMKYLSSRSRSSSRSRHKYKTKSRSPYRPRSDSRSPQRYRRKSPRYRAKSRSPYRPRSYSRSPQRYRRKPPRYRAKSRSPYRPRSYSKSPQRHRGAPRYRTKSRSPELKMNDSRSPRRRKRSGSPRYKTKSRSPLRLRSYSRSSKTKSRSLERHRFHSNSPKRYRNYSRSHYRHSTRSRSRSKHRYRKHSKSPYRRRNDSGSTLQDSHGHGTSSRSRSKSDSERSDGKTRSRNRSDRRLRSAKRNRLDESLSDYTRSRSRSKDDRNKTRSTKGSRRERFEDGTVKDESDDGKVIVVKTKLVKNPGTGRWERKQLSPEKTEKGIIDLDIDKPTEYDQNSRLDGSDNVWRDIIWDKKIDVEMAYHDLMMMLQKDQQYYELTEELCSELGLQYTRIVGILEMQGIKSLGKTRMETFYSIIASLLVLVFVIKIQYREKYVKNFPDILSPTFTYTTLRVESTETFTITFGDDFVLLPFELHKVLEWLEEQERLMPALYKVLELGKTKMEFIANLCGIFANL